MENLGKLRQATKCNLRSIVSNARLLVALQKSRLFLSDISAFETDLSLSDVLLALQPILRFNRYSYTNGAQYLFASHDAHFLNMA